MFHYGYSRGTLIGKNRLQIGVLFTEMNLQRYGLNFIKVLRAAFVPVDPKSAKRY